MSRLVALLLVLALHSSTVIDGFAISFPVQADDVKTAGKAVTSADRESENHEPLLSVVLLQKELPAVSEKSIAESIQRTWKQKVSIGHDSAKGGTSFVTKEGPGFMIRCQDTFCMLIAARKPYLEGEALNEVQELRTRRMLREHKTWLSLDLIGEVQNKPADLQEQEMNRIIQLAAEMVDKNTVGVLLPNENLVLPVSDEVIAAMKGREALKTLRQSSNAAVIGAASDDPEMLAATTKARQTWQEFVKAFQDKPKNTESFAAKFPFDAPDQKEFMWVEVVSINGDTIVGRLGNDPVWVKELKLGDEVEMKLSELSDWMYLKDGEIIGGYTVKVLMKKQQQKAE